jgi:hypothetical protein
MKVCKAHHEEDCRTCFKAKDKRASKSLVQAQRRALQKALDVLYRRQRETWDEEYAAVAD